MLLFHTNKFEANYVLLSYCSSLESEFPQIDKERKKNLAEIADYISEK